MKHPDTARFLCSQAMVCDFTSIDDISDPTPLRADVETLEAALEAWTGFRPRTPVVEGVARFAAWSRHDDGS